MTSLAAVKRRAQLGVLVHAVMHTPDHERPGAWRKGNPPPRRISRVQTNAIAFEPCEWSHNRESWLWWPKAAEVTLHGDDSFTIGEITYTFAAAEQTRAA